MQNPCEDIKFTLKALQTNKVYKGASIPLWLKVLSASLVILLVGSFWAWIISLFNG